MLVAAMHGLVACRRLTAGDALYGRQIRLFTQDLVCLSRY